MTTRQSPAADVAVERPDIRWLFGGFGFQNAEAQLTPLMTESFRNDRARFVK